MTANTDTVSRMQQIQIELIRESSFNDFDGNLVTDSLLANRDLWIAFLMDRASYGAFHEYTRARNGERPEMLPVEPIDTIRLRDLAANYWNVDTLYVLPQPEKEDKLELLARREWRADEIDWYDPLDASWIWLEAAPRVGESIKSIRVERMLRVWWD